MVAANLSHYRMQSERKHTTINTTCGLSKFGALLGETKKSKKWKKYTNICEIKIVK